MKPKSFPHTVESLTPWRAKVYESTSRGRDYFKLVYYAGENRKTLGFSSWSEVEKGIDDLIQRFGESEGGSLVLSANDAARYQQAEELRKQLHGVPAINICMADYVSAKKILGDISLKEAAEFYAKRRGLNLPERTVAEVVQEMLKAKRAAKLSARYIKDLENRLTRFGNDCQCQLVDLTTAKISAWLRGLGLSARSYNNFRTSIETLITFAKSCGYLTRDWDDLEDVPREKDKGGAVEIFTPEEISQLLTHANDKLLPFVAIGAFAGVRSAELERLTWAKVDLKRGYITIDAAIAKKNSRRVIPIQDNLRAWITPHWQKQGKVCAYGNVTNELLKLSRAAGVDWKQNALRHSFASYRLATVQDAAKVALEMGNSPKMIQQHYLELVTPEDGATWFAVAPARAKNVVALAG
jgi:integrase